MTATEEFQRVQQRSHKSIAVSLMLNELFRKETSRRTFKSSTDQIQLGIKPGTPLTSWELVKVSALMLMSETVVEEKSAVVFSGNTEFIWKSLLSNLKKIKLF